MTTLPLSIAASALAFVSAVLWFYASLSVSHEKEIARRKKLAKREGKTPNLGGVLIGDEGKNYDLIATLRHQAKWNKWGAITAGLAIGLQAATPLI